MRESRVEKNFTYRWSKRGMATAEGNGGGKWRYICVEMAATLGFSRMSARRKGGKLARALHRRERASAMAGAGGAAAGGEVKAGANVANGAVTLGFPACTRRCGESPACDRRAPREPAPPEMPKKCMSEAWLGGPPCIARAWPNSWCTQPK